MTFLAPLFLSLAVLAGVPLLVHLLRRRVTRPVAFPAVRFLQQSQREHDRERLVRNRLLLLLRLLAVLALVAAVARPVANLGGSGHPPLALAIVLDESMSTGAVVEGRTLFARLQEAARAVVGDLATDDRAWLVTTGGTVVAGDGPALRAALDGLSPTTGRGDLPGAMRRAQRLVAAGAPRTPVIVVLTDGQRTALPETPDVLDLGTAALVVHVPPVTPPVNRAVLDVTADPERWVPAGRVRARLAAPADVPWRVLLGERTLARGTIREDSATGAAVADDAVVGGARVVVEAVAADTGWLAGRVELDPDDFPGDDVRHFAVRVAPATPVRVEPSAGPFVAAALETLIAEGRVRRGTTADRDIVRVLAATEVVTGPAVRLAPADPLQLVSANRALERAGIPWRFGAPLRDSATIRSATGDSVAARASVAGATTSLRYRLTRAPGTADSGRVVLEAGGAPWLVTGRDYVLVGSPLAPAATDAPLRGGFVPWLLDLVSRQLGDDGHVLAAAPGDTLTPSFAIDSVRGPSGTAEAVSGVALVVPATTGVHLLRRLGRTVGALVVNPEASESSVSAWGDSVWQGAWVVATRQVESDPSRLPSAVFDRTGGRSIVWPLVLLALCALAAEALVARGWLAPAGDDASRAGAAVTASARP